MPQPTARSREWGLKKVRMLYQQLQQQMETTSHPTTSEQESQFGGMMKGIQQRTQGIATEVPQGISHLRKELYDEGIMMQDSQELNFVLQQFYCSKVAMQVLIDQYVECHKGFFREGYCGLIKEETFPSEVISAVIADAQFMCARQNDRLRRKDPNMINLQVPEVKVIKDIEYPLPYIPDLLYYILLELMKNSLRAVSEVYGIQAPGTEVPPIQVYIYDSECNHDTVIKISDLGGGIPRSKANHIFKFMVTSAPLAVQEAFLTTLGTDLQQTFTSSSPLFGLGVGLPMARVYARNFGGDVQLASIERRGTDAYIYLSKAGSAYSCVADMI